MLIKFDLTSKTYQACNTIKKSCIPGRHCFDCKTNMH